MKRLLALLVLMVAPAILQAEGLSWTGDNSDQLCDHKKFLICSYARIYQMEGAVAGLKLFRLHILMFLMPGLPADYASSVTMTIVLETADHVPHTYIQEKLPIEIDRKNYPDGTSITTRSCTADIDLTDKGVTAVLGIDASQKDAKGEIVSRHQFR
jgi:hypothetical protein